MSVGPIGGKVVRVEKVEPNIVRAQTPEEGLEEMAEEGWERAMPITQDRLEAERHVGRDEEIEGVPRYKHVQYTRNGEVYDTTVVTDSTETRTWVG